MSPGKRLLAVALVCGVSAAQSAPDRVLDARAHDRWKPGKVDTATALKEAQEFVRSQEKWKHPYYWAAWQLWGLGD